MKYLEPSFHQFAVGTKEYRDNWDAIFGKKETPADEAPKKETLLGPEDKYPANLVIHALYESMLALESAASKYHDGDCEVQAIKLYEVLKILRG